jgi:flagellar hook assembly protein FlgD
MAAACGEGRYRTLGINAVSPIVSTENSLTSYPNPFTQSTTISFTTPESSVATVAIVNILGATVAHIFSGELDAGTHTFTWDANGLPAGVYECIVQMNGNVERTAMVVN